MPEPLEPRFTEALRLRDEAKFAESEDILSELSSEYPQTAAVWLMLGHVRWKREDLSAATESFRRASILAPKMELASLGLFHTLWELGRRDEAFEEARRYITLAGPSKEYGMLLRELEHEP